MKSEKKLFIITGGTIDSYYESSKDTILPNKKSIIAEVLKNFKADENCSYSLVCMKDSRALTEADRKKVLEVIKKTPHKKIIITHGTYTMPDTARFLNAHLKKSNKTIVLTGAMIPITGFCPSDGTFNLGYTMAIVEYLKPGIYVAMNGKVFDPSEVMKDLSAGKFSSIFSE